MMNHGFPGSFPLGGMRPTGMPRGPVGFNPAANSRLQPTNTLSAHSRSSEAQSSLRTVAPGQGHQLSVATMPAQQMSSPSITQQSDILHDAKKSVEEFVKKEAVANAELMQFKSKCSYLEQDLAESHKLNKTLREEHARLNQLIANERSNWQQLHVGLLEVRARSHAVMEEVRQIDEWKNQAASDGDQIKKQLMELQIRAKSLVEELQKTQEEKSHMFRDLDAARCEIDTQQSVILDLQTSLKDYQTIIQQKNASFDELTQANSPRTLQEDLSRERQTRQHLEALCRDKDAENAQLRASGEDVVAQNHDLKCLVESIKSEHQDKLEETKRALWDSKAQADSLGAQLEQVNLQHTETIQKLGESMDELGKLRPQAQESKRLAEECQVLRQKLGVQEEEYLKAISTLNSLRDELKESNASNEGLKELCAALESENDTIKAQVDALSKEKNQAIEEHNSTQETLQQARAEYENLQNMMQSEIQSRDKQIALISKSLNDMTAQLNNVAIMATAADAHNNRPAPVAAMTIFPSVRRNAEADDSRREKRSEMPPPPPKNVASKTGKSTTSASAKAGSSEVVNLSAYSRVLAAKPSKPAPTGAKSTSTAKPASAAKAPKRAGSSKKAVDSSQSDDDVFSFK